MALVVIPTACLGPSGLWSADPGLRRTLNGCVGGLREGKALRRDEGMVRIRLREWYVLTVSGSDHPEQASLVLISGWLPCRTLHCGQ